MKKIYSDIIQFRGNHYDYGFLQGELLKDSLSVKNREDQWKVRKPRFTINVEEAKSMITHFAPGVWDELMGLQEALEWPIERVLQEYGGYRVNHHKSGCSIYIGEDYLIRNYDYHPKTYEGRYTLFQPTDGMGYSMIGPSQRVTGRMDGMNECGLAMGYNFMNRRRPGDGFICCMIGRLILESCQDVEEAVAMLKEIPHRHSFTYVVHDQKGRSAAVETTPREVTVRETLSCTNHFEKLLSENRHQLADSKRRLAVMEENRAAMSSPEQAFQLMNGIGKGVFSDLYGSWAGTIHTSVYFPRSLKVWMALGGNQQPYEIDFASWILGKELSIERMTGKVDTDIPFLHMDEGANWFK